MSTATTQTTATTQNDDWTMEVPKPGTGDYVLCPAGNYPATIIAVLDVGTHDEENDKKETRKVRKLAMGYELKKTKADGKPFVLADRYTMSMSEKAKFYGIVCGVLGRKFKEGEQFDPRMLLGIPVMLNVTNSSKGDKTYHAIASVGQYPEGFEHPVPTLAPFAWTIRSGQPLPDAVNELPYIYGDPIKKICAESDEGKARAARPNGDEIPF